MPKNLNKPTADATDADGDQRQAGVVWTVFCLWNEKENDRMLFSR